MTNRKELRPYQRKVVDDLINRLLNYQHPILVNASVGAGKSLIIAELLLWCERVGIRTLCLTLSSTLIQQNANTHKLQNGQCGIYCASLNTKDFEDFVIFASPHSICKDISHEGNISRQPFELIIVDECHHISPHNEHSMYMRIFNHYGAVIGDKQLKVIGLTGTPYRDKQQYIVGEGQLFQEEACSITASWLIDNSYLVPPYFGLPDTGSFDFSHVRVNSNGKFNGKDLQQVVDENERLTAKIMRELTEVIESGYNGAFIFATNKKHCDECARSLPDGQWAIITGDTPHEKREEYLSKARQGVIKYLINVNCLTTGVDVTSFDVVAWLRPTESLVLYIQGIGRVLRLHPGKRRALVLDYAGNIERHGEIDDPIINQALQPQPENIQDYCIPCYACNTLNTIHARRCIGVSNNVRCDYYFEFKDCPACGAKNDIVAHACRSCQEELLDPNSKLSIINKIYEVPVKKASYFISVYKNYAIINVMYYLATPSNHVAQERFFTSSEKALRITYHKFLKEHFDTPSKYYKNLSTPSAAYRMIQSPELKTPKIVHCKMKEDLSINIIKKVFQQSID